MESQSSLPPLVNNEETLSRQVSSNELYKVSKGSSRNLVGSTSKMVLNSDLADCLPVNQSGAVRRLPSNRYDSNRQPASPKSALQMLPSIKPQKTNPASPSSKPVLSFSRNHSRQTVVKSHRVEKSTPRIITENSEDNSDDAVTHKDPKRELEPMSLFIESLRKRQIYDPHVHSP